MIKVDFLEATEPAKDFKMHIGTFSYEINGERYSAEFYIRTCEDDEDKQYNDYNQQLCDEYDELEERGATKVSYVEVVPCPI